MVVRPARLFVDKRIGKRPVVSALAVVAGWSAGGRTDGRAGKLLVTLNVVPSLTVLLQPRKAANKSLRHRKREMFIGFILTTRPAKDCSISEMADMLSAAIQNHRVS